MNERYRPYYAYDNYFSPARPPFTRPEPVGPTDLASLVAKALGFSLSKPKTAEEIEAERREKAFRELDIKNGDEVELRSEKSTLQGIVTQVREQDGQPQVRISGFDESPHGTQNIWFGVRNYESIRLINRGFRWTELDKMIVALVGTTPAAWEARTEEARERSREVHGKKVDRLLAVIKAESEWSHLPSA
jgi:hypothetical protein